MTEKTIEELNAEKSALELEFAQHELGIISTVVDTMNSDEIAAFRAQLVTACASMPSGDAKSQMTNLTVVLERVPSFLQQYLLRLEQRIAQGTNPGADTMGILPPVFPPVTP